MKIFGIEIGRSKKEKVKNFLPIGELPDPLVELPVRGGVNAGEVAVIGTVLPTNTDSIQGLSTAQRPLTLSDYKKLYNLAASNHDVSFAISNIVELANTKISIKFDPGVSESQGEAMMASIKEAEKTWYQGGRSMLVNSLFRQVAITGAISAEAKPRADLSGVGAMVLLSPKWVYFWYDQRTASWRPFQQVVAGANLFERATVPNIGYGYQRLSLKTYKYIAISRDEDLPYAIPPIWSAIEAVCIENDMLDNLSAVVKRLGMFGFLQVIVNAPTRSTNTQGNPETDEEYIERVQNYIQSLEPEIEKGLSNGYVITAKQIDGSGTERKTDFEMTSSTSDAAGGAKLLELIMQIKAAGLKQDPVFLGKNFTTSEALAKVLLKKFAGQLGDYQEATAQILQHAYELHLRLQGFDFNYVEVSFAPPILEDTKTLYEGLNQKYVFYKSLYDQGLINQQQFAQYMDLDAPAEDGPRQAPAPVVETEPENDEEGEPASDSEQESMSLGELASASDNAFKWHLSGYNRKTMRNLESAAGYVSDKVVEMLNLLESDINLDTAKQWAWRSVLMNWHQAFTKEQMSITANHTSLAYTKFRKDRSIFKGLKKNAKGEKIPKAEMNILDQVFVQDFENNDVLAIGGALITGRTKEKVEAIVAKYHKEGALPLRNSGNSAAKFKKDFAKAIKLNSGELMKITSMTIANIRAVAGLMYLRQAEFEDYEIGGSASISCENCQKIEGNVSEAVYRISELIRNNARNVLTPPVALVSGTDYEISQAFETCRCRIFGKIKS